MRTTDRGTQYDFDMARTDLEREEGDLALIFTRGNCVSLTESELMCILDELRVRSTQRKMKEGYER